MLPRMLEKDGCFIEKGRGLLIRRVSISFVYAGLPGPRTPYGGSTRRAINHFDDGPSAPRASTPPATPSIMDGDNPPGFSPDRLSQLGRDKEGEQTDKEGEQEGVDGDVVMGADGTHEEVQPAPEALQGSGAGGGDLLESGEVRRWVTASDGNKLPIYSTSCMREVTLESVRKFHKSTGRSQYTQNGKLIMEFDPFGGKESYPSHMQLT